MGESPRVSLPADTQQRSRWRQWIGSNPDDIRERLLILGDELNTALQAADLIYGAFWSALGVQVHPVNLPNSLAGTSGIIDGEWRIAVNAADDRRRQRFTIGHELAHLLLPSAPSRWAAGSEDVERVCDEFAAHLLTSTAELARQAGDLRSFRPADLLDLAAKLRLSLSATVTALARLHWPPDGALLLIRSYAHRAVAAQAPRVSARATGATYFPLHQRLTSIGLADLHTFVCSAPGTPPGTPVAADPSAAMIPGLLVPQDSRSAAGTDSVVNLRTAIDGRWIPVAGAATWSAYSGGQSDARWVIAVLQLDVQPIHGASPRIRGRRKRTTVSDGQQQLGGSSFDGL